MLKSCREITRLVSEAQERQLSLSEGANVRLHLAVCSGCRNFSNQMKTLREIARCYTNGSGAANDAAADSRNQDNGDR
ncbi:zf-HC2 domain-containing protein [Microbulbifer magnicolonia]|uniref:zf-HC2 domain-containing protein n=1 Tax=Microbulbifer magnicolonia TaxID=3109744 RepID=UPI002B41808E|nr:zf-HC2 domain-containing protein [Microbulbifer sp. GG15]